MPSVNTHGDSLTIYYSGASSDGGNQVFAAGCLGNYRSSTELYSLVATISNPISGITINYIDGSNGIGSGSLIATDANNVTWTPPNGTAGLPVTIANGETKIIEPGGTDKTPYIEISRTSAVSLSGTATVTLAYADNNPVAMGNVSTTEQTNGSTKYRALFVKNTSANTVSNVTVLIGCLGTDRVSGGGQLGASGAGTISVSTGNFNDWPDSGFCRIESALGTVREIVYYSSRSSSALTVPSSGRGLLGTSVAAGSATDLIYPVPGLRIAAETPSTNAIQTIPDESTAPSGRTFKTGVRTLAGASQTANGASLGSMAAGALMAFWIERTVVAGGTPSPSVQAKLVIDFDAS